MSAAGSALPLPLRACLRVLAGRRALVHCGLCDWPHWHDDCEVWWSAGTWHCTDEAACARRRRRATSAARELGGEWANPSPGVWVRTDPAAREFFRSAGLGDFAGRPS